MTWIQIDTRFYNHQRRAQLPLFKTLYQSVGRRVVEICFIISSVAEGLIPICWKRFSRVLVTSCNFGIILVSFAKFTNTRIFLDPILDEQRGNKIREQLVAPKLQHQRCKSSSVICRSAHDSHLPSNRTTDQSVSAGTVQWVMFSTWHWLKILLYLLVLLKETTCDFANPAVTANAKRCKEGLSGNHRSLSNRTNENQEKNWITCLTILSEQESPATDS